MNVYQHDPVVPFKDSDLSKKKQVEEMFDRIAKKYDFLNRFLSARIDVIWRRKAIKKLTQLAPENVLDVATGTGDFAIMCYKTIHPKKIIGIDISAGMINVGNEKIKKLGLEKNIELIKGDGETILFPENSFDAVIVAFGVRNFEDLEKGLCEINRVLRTGGKLVILEFSKSNLPVIKTLYKLYMEVITPLFVKLFSKNHEAYEYLNESVKKFPEGKNFTSILDKVGFKKTSQQKLTLGICSIYCGEK